MNLREAREAAYWEHWRRSLRESPREGLPAFLDALEAIDREHAVPAAVIEVDGELTEEEAALVHAAIREQAREAADLLRQPAAPVKPATRRREARKEG